VFLSVFCIIFKFFPILSKFAEIRIYSSILWNKSISCQKVIS
jgi:hypothetical protein